jgi:hypothetical protein
MSADTALAGSVDRIERLLTEALAGMKFPGLNDPLKDWARIRFALRDLTQSPSIDAAAGLVKVARAAWRALDESCEQPGEGVIIESARYSDLCAALDDLEALPVIPGYVAEGPARAEHALGLSKLPPGDIQFPRHAL